MNGLRRTSRAAVKGRGAGPGLPRSATGTGAGVCGPERARARGKPAKGPLLTGTATQALTNLPPQAQRELPLLLPPPKATKNV